MKRMRRSQTDFGNEKNRLWFIFHKQKPCTSFPTSSLGTERSEAPLHHAVSEKNGAFPNRGWERETSTLRRSRSAFSETGALRVNRLWFIFHKQKPCTSFPTSSLGTAYSEAPLHHFLNEKNEAFPNRFWEREKFLHHFRQLAIQKIFPPTLPPPLLLIIESAILDPPFTMLQFDTHTLPLQRARNN